MARYMGSTASIAHILHKLTVIFGIVASFDILMQNFYKFTQSNHEKVTSFAMRLEGTLNQIRLQCPRRIMDWEVQQHLKDCLFHGVCMQIRDWIWYLYSNPRITYSQLMIAAHKGESENKEAQDKVRARSVVTTEPIKGPTELGNQMAKLMAALTRAGQGNSPGSAPNIPRHSGHGRGQMDRNTPGHPNSHIGQKGLRQTTSACSVSASHGTGTTRQSQGNAKGSKDSQGNTSNRKDKSFLQCFRCQGWDHMAQECATPAKTLNQSGGPKGMQPSPHQQQLQMPTVGPQHSLPDPKPKLTILKVAQKKWQQEIAPVPFLNPDTKAHLVGHSNEPPVIVDLQEMTALIDLGARVSSVSSQFCKDLTQQIQPLGQLLELEQTGDAATLYLGFVEVNLQIPGITNYNEDVLLVVIPTTTYSKIALIVVGSKIIDRALSLMTKGELTKAATMWRQAHFGAVMSGSLQLTHTSSDKTGMEEEVGHSSHSGDPMEVRKFCLNDIRGPVHTTPKGHHTPIQHNKCACQFQCQRTLYVGPCTHRTDATSPVACSSGTNSDLWRITSQVLQGTYLSVQLECPYCGNFHKGCGWTGCLAN